MRAFPRTFGVVLRQIVKQSRKGVPESHQPVPAALAVGVHSADDLSELRGRGAHVPARGGR